MIKGFRFTNQLSNAEVDARIHQKIFNNNDGIFYGMELSNTSNSISITEGLCEIAGRPVGVVGSETVQVSLGNFYCLLVLEIDLAKESTKEIFNQAAFKILTSSTTYPIVTKQDINKINGTNKLYQLEFARFRTTASGITDFQDKRTFLDFSSIYNQIQTEYRAVLEQLQEELSNVKDGSDYLLKSAGGTVEGLIIAKAGINGNVTGNVSGSSGSCTGNATTASKLKNARTINLTGDLTGNTSFDGSKDVSINVKLANISVLTGTINATAASSGDSHSFNTVKINFPQGFNSDNCVVLSWYVHRQTSSGAYGKAFGCTTASDSRTWLRGGYPSMITFNFQNDNKITFTLENPITSATNFDYKIVLMKI